MRRHFLTKKEAKKLVKELPIAYHDHGRHVGINVKVHKFPGPIDDVLWEAILLANAFESDFGTVIGSVWDLVKDEVNNELGVSLYSAGRSGGYWGFSTYDLEKQGIREERAIQVFRKALANALHACFGGREVRLFSLGYDLNPRGTEMIYAEIYCVFDPSLEKGYCKKVLLSGVDQWVGLQPEMEALVQEGEYQEVARLWADFVTAWRMRCVVCKAA